MFEKKRRCEEVWQGRRIERMKQTIVGKRVANYKDKSGQPVSGIGLYFMGASEGVEGMKTGDVFIKAPGNFTTLQKICRLALRFTYLTIHMGVLKGWKLSPPPKQGSLQPQEPAKNDTVRA